jgi:hypothetical protein
MSTNTKEQVAEVIQMARDRALGIKLSCYCHALSSNRRPCVACESNDIILALCNALEISTATLEKTNDIVKEFATGIRQIIGEPSK